MSKYEIITVHDWDNIWYAIFDTEGAQYFAGYDFMGSVNWQSCISPECYISEEDEAEQIIRDLESADEETERGMILTIDDAKIGNVNSYNQDNGNWVFHLFNGIEVKIPFYRIKIFSSSGKLDIITNH